MRIFFSLLLLLPFISKAQAPLQTSSKVIVDDGYDYTELSVTPWGGSHGIFFGSKVSYTGTDYLWGSGNAVYARDAGQYSYGAFSLGYVANGGQFSFFDGGLSTGAGNQISWNTVMTIMRGGNIGIGTTPAYKLDVYGITRAKSFFADVQATTQYSGDYQFNTSGAYKGRLIWYQSSYSGLPSNSITIENSTGVPIAHFFENGNTTLLGNVGIGTTNPQAKLAVNGDIFSKKIKVTQTGWSDYVFHPTYKLPSLKEVEEYIKRYQHLPEIPSATEVQNNGLDLGDNQAALLKKIEELTLYIIDQDKKIKSQQKQITELLELKKDLDTIKSQLKTN